MPLPRSVHPCGKGAVVHRMALSRARSHAEILEVAGCLSLSHSILPPHDVRRVRNERPVIMMFGLVFLHEKPSVPRGHAARIFTRNSLTSIRSVAAWVPKSRADVRIRTADEPVSVTATPLMLLDTCSVACATSCTFRAISCVAAPCSSHGRRDRGRDLVDGGDRANNAWIACTVMVHTNISKHVGIAAFGLDWMASSIPAGASKNSPRHDIRPLRMGRPASGNSWLFRAPSRCCNLPSHSVI